MIQNPFSMAPRTPQHPRILEDYEIFEAEAAELSIEDVDDFAASLLLSSECHDGNGHSGRDISVAASRNFNPLQSPHSLATTSIVSTTQHAQTTECKLVGITTSASTAQSYPQTCLITECALETNLGSLNSHVSTTSSALLPVHILTAVPHISAHFRSPSSWPRHLLAFTDAPAFVRAVTSDLKLYWTNLAGPAAQQFASVLVTSCDQSFAWTTCQLACCEADVDLLKCGLCVKNGDENPNLQSPCDPSPSTSSRTVSKRSHSEPSPLPLCINKDCLQKPNELTIQLCPFSGVRPEILQATPVSTAVYLLLIEDLSFRVGGAQENGCKKAHIRTAFSEQSLDYATTKLTTGSGSSPKGHFVAESPLLLAMLISFCSSSDPISSSHNNFSAQINHRFIQPRHAPFLHRDRRFVALLAMVDIVNDSDADGNPRLLGIIHQRLHYFPQLTFDLHSFD
ncbi:unnamed protein product [Calicophoron daubneyi]|uniref:Uncharacterized protein n=1 Tax=Calicophoron daubneyi TaxID=300641 RepID=A0AAV2T2P2_CALDB